MTEAPETINFNQAADFYDSTRDFGDRRAADTLDHVSTELRGLGPVLEVGVGTGLLALPLASRGLDVVGVDVSTAMLAKLRQKSAAGEGRVRLAEADARRLPFPDGAFGSAYLRHVLHLIPDWPVAAAELCRVVGPGGTILVDAGRDTPEWQEFRTAVIAPMLGPEGYVVGLELGRDGADVLNDGFRSAGAEPDGVTVFSYPNDETWSRVLDEIEARSPSWSWRASDDAIQRMVEAARVWIVERFGDLDALVSESFEVDWYRFRLGDEARNA